MVEIKLKNEGLPTRCEICHQVDLFDATNNHCKRCSSLISNQTFPLSPPKLTSYVSLLNHCQKILEDFSLSIGQVFTIALMLFLPFLGVMLGNLISLLLEKVFFINTSSIGGLIISLGVILGFSSLFLIAKLVIRKTNIKLAPFIDLKVKTLIKNSLRKN
ncbi:MAG: hypothetical protein HY819_19610 [Acidobacteria bacterium]|nr:hypothetical protein [Acidobacteriota bacterium]